MQTEILKKSKEWVGSVFIVEPIYVYCQIPTPTWNSAFSNKKVTQLIFPFQDVNWQDLRDCEICPPLQPLSQYGGSITFDIAGYGIEKGTWKMRQDWQNLFTGDVLWPLTNNNHLKNTFICKFVFCLWLHLLQVDLIIVKLDLIIHPIAITLSVWSILISLWLNQLVTGVDHLLIRYPPYVIFIYIINALERF